MGRKNPKFHQEISNFITSREVILIVIVVSMLLVLLATIFTLISSPEKQAKDKITQLAEDYYESYIYQDILKNNNYSDITGILERYKDGGFSTLTLRQIILHDEEKNSAVHNYLKKYCDEDNTLIKIYPEPPFDNTSYRVDYTYACDF